MQRLQSDDHAETAGLGREVKSDRRCHCEARAARSGPVACEHSYWPRLNV